MSQTDALGNIIKRARLARGMSQMKLRDKIKEETGVNIHPSTISRLEKGKTGRPDKCEIEVLANVLELPVDRMLRLADYNSEIDFINDMVRIPLADIAGGPGVMPDQEIYLPRSLLPIKDVVAYRVRGQSMQPDILEGDIVVVNLWSQPNEKDIVVAWTSCGGVVKRLIFRDGEPFLMGNSGEPIPVDDSVRIEGKVIFVGKFL